MSTTNKYKDVKAIVELLNNPESWGCSLEEILQDRIEWSYINPDAIISKYSLREFTKGILDKEIRLDVMKFLLEYASYYFYDSAKSYVRNRNGQPMRTDLLENQASIAINEFQSELATQISQIERTGMFSGDKFSKLQKRNEQLEKLIKELVDKVAALETQLDKYKHPSNYGKHIPKELDNEEFYNIMGHLAADGIVRVVSQPDSNGYYKVVCYQWDATMALFGYFVEKMNEAMNLRGSRVPLKWKVFEPAINNYDEIVKEARKAISTYNNSSSLQKSRIDKAELVDKAIARKHETYLPF